MKKDNGFFPIWSLAVIFLVFSLQVFPQQVEHTSNNKDKTLRSNARINPSTLAMEFSLPIAGMTGRGGNALGLSLEYSSKVWGTESDTFFDGANNKTNVTAEFAGRSHSGWTSTLDVPRLSLPDTSLGNDPGEQTELYKDDGSPWKYEVDSPPPTNFSIFYVSRLRLRMPDGSTRELRRDDAVSSHATAQSPLLSESSVYYGTYLATDGSRTRLELSWVSSELRTILYMPDGSRYLDLPADYAISRDTVFIDRHGNRMSYNSGTRIWTDTLGRTIENPLANNLINTTTAGTLTKQFPGMGSTAQEYQMVWANLDTQQSTLAYIGNYYCLGAYTYAVPGGSTVLFTNTGTFGSRFCGYNMTFNPVVLTEVRLPDGTAYKFKYNNYGEIEKIEYPTGGYEKFTYNYLPQLSATAAMYYDQVNRGVTERRVSADGTTQSEVVWQYQIQKETVAANQIGPYHVKTFAPDGTWSEQLLKDEYNHRAAPYGFGDPTIGRAYEARVYNNTTNNTLLRRTLTKWISTGPQTINGVAGHSSATRDLRPEKEISIVFEPGNSYALIQMSETEYDTTGSTDLEQFAALNPKRVKTYKYKVLSASTAATADFATIAANFTSSDVVSISETDYLYDSNYKTRGIVGLGSETRVIDSSNSQVKAKSQIVYDESNYSLSSTGTMPSGASNSWLDPLTELGATIGSKRGLPTSVKSYSDIAANQYVETHSFYDQYGNTRKVRDGRGNDSEIQYSATYAFAYPTKTISAVPDSTGVNGSNQAFETTSVYNYNTGLPLSTTDPNGLTVEMEYDAYLSPYRTTPKQNGIAVGSITETSYGVPDTNGQLSAAQRFVKVKTQIDDTKWKEGYSWFDGLGRTVKSQSVDSQGDVFVETEYDNMGRAKRATNPYRTGETKLWTESTYDDLSRVTKVKTPDLAEVNTAYALGTGTTLGTVVTVTDQAGKQRRSITNALGQLTRVDEPTDTNGLGAVDNPNQPTSYSYDTLNNLTTVTQGSQTRSFVYDSLSRLKSATNPESGLIQYSYDNNGNLTSKIDARSITTTYAYDNLNRVKTRSYTGEPTGQQTPTVNYYYDGVGATISNSKGKLTKVSSSVSTTKYTGFDAMGRVLSHKQTTDGTDYTTGYAYNLSGALIEETYPSTRVVKNVLDNDGDLSIVQSKKNANSGYWNYAKNFTYTAAGAVSSMQLGNGKWESTQFNSRLQPTQIALGTTQNGTDKLNLNFAYNTTGQNDNNGNVLSQTITVPTVGAANGFTATQAYTYDSLNRLKSAEETIPGQTGWKQTFTYDRYGNRRFDTTTSATTTTLPAGCQTAVCNPTIDPATNKLIGYSYDNAGNTTVDALGKTFTYDGENKQIKLVSGSQTLGEYFYDGDGKRVKKIALDDNQLETTIFVYNASGQLVAEYATQIAATPQVSYLTSDHLGSPRINTDQNGAVISRHDYQPFGEEIYPSVGNTARTGYGTDDVRQQFTSYERDSETDLDFAQARMYSSKLGRFSSPDTFWKDSHVADPQSWNKYAYVRNNPLSLIDTTGEKATVVVSVNEKDKTVTVNITASIGIWSKDKATKKQLNAMAKNIEKQIESRWSGTFDKDGYSYTVSTDVNVQGYGGNGNSNANSNDDVLNADNTMQNVIEIVPDNLMNGSSGVSNPHTDPSNPVNGTNPDGTKPDLGRWRANAALVESEPGHEFGHLLGINQHLPNTNHIMSVNSTATIFTMGDYGQLRDINQRVKTTSRLASAKYDSYKHSKNPPKDWFQQSSNPLTVRFP